MSGAIYELSTCELSAALRSCEEVVRALQQRAAEHDPAIGGFSEPLFRSALKQAKLRDAERARGENVGPLHGVRFSLKDNINLQGAFSSVGLVESRTRAAESAVVARFALAGGAVCIGKSNVPQAMLSMRGKNNLYGEAKNPWSEPHVTGGSGAGEAALIAYGASPCGFGTGLGGSIRFPAGFCGVAGFKPTQDMWSNRGIETAISGQEFVRAQVGPMARRVEDLQLLMSALCPQKQAPHDGRVPPIAWNSLAAASARVGVCFEDGVTKPNPAMVRAVAFAKRALEDQGVEVVAFRPPNRFPLVLLYLAAVGADGMETLKARFGRETPDVSTRLLWSLGRAPKRLRRVVVRILETLGERRLAEITAHTGPRPVARLFELYQQRARRQAEEEAAWRSAGIDALICPASATPAVPRGEEGDAALIFSHYCPYNLFGMPAGVVPVTRVRARETPIQLAPGADRIDKRLASVASKSEGLPVGVQVVGHRYGDRQVLEVMATIERAARQGDEFPHTPVAPQ